MLHDFLGTKQHLKSREVGRLAEKPRRHPSSLDGMESCGDNGGAEERRKGINGGAAH